MVAIEVKKIIIDLYFSIGKLKVKQQIVRLTQDLMKEQKIDKN